MTLTYNISREDAAVQLGVSTRTIDRYVKSGKFHYKKVANKVLLAREEVEAMQQEFSLLHQQEWVSVVGVRESDTTDLATHAWISSTNIGGVKEFVDVLNKKDQSIEEKNQIIYMLQRKIGEMETQLKQMIALPDHSKEKEYLVHNIQQLEIEKISLEESMKKEKLFGTIFAAIACIAVIMFLYFVIA